MAKQFLVFQHTPWEGPGKLLLDTARKQNAGLEIIKVWQQPIPDLSNYDGLLVLGGGPNVDQEKEYPFLVSEKRAIRQSIADNRPYLGICLGHQLLADALGAKVGPNFRASVGFITGHLTHDGREHPAFAGQPKSMPFFKWHSQAVQEPLPRNVTILATSVDCLVEAISVTHHPHILGIQFDNHAADPEDVRLWLDKDAEWSASLPDIKVDPKAMLAAAYKHKIKVAQQFELLFSNFLTLIK